MVTEDKLIFLGVISAAYGIKGEVIVKTFNADPEKLSEMHILDSEGESIDLKFIRVYPKGGIIARIGNCCTRSEAEKLAKTKLYCYRSMLPQTEEDEFYIADLVEMKVFDQQNNLLGVVAAVHNFGAGDILEIEYAESKKREMFPFTKEFFPEILKDRIIANNLSLG